MTFDPQYERFKQIVLHLIRVEHVHHVSIFEVQTEMGTLDSQHDNALRFKREFPLFADYLKPRAKQPNRAKASRSHRPLAFAWLRTHWNDFLTLEAVCLSTLGRINFKRALREAGIKEYNNLIMPTLRRLLLKRNPSLQGRLKIRKRTVSGTTVMA
jgi:hypothetical protein